MNKSVNEKREEDRTFKMSEDKKVKERPKIQRIDEDEDEEEEGEISVRTFLRKTEEMEEQPLSEPLGVKSPTDDANGASNQNDPSETRPTEKETLEAPEHGRETLACATEGISWVDEVEREEGIRGEIRIREDLHCNEERSLAEALKADLETVSYTHLTLPTIYSV